MAEEKKGTESLPENEPIVLDQIDINEQFGSMVAQIVVQQKTERKLREIIVKLRARLK